MGRISVATIDNPEFINLQKMDINPLMSKCEIKVLYVGENRNRSYISKDVAIEMSKTLRGAPIVGWYKEEKEDYVDHGDRITIDGEGIKFESLTRPYGFVSPDADVWFQKFEDEDEFGNKIEREYLMTTGYLWTGQYEEAKLAVEGEGRPQSMELDEETLDGHWAENYNSGLEFFIINDAIFSKLCILGEDVEPCFEGSSITAPKVSSSFTLNDDFKQTLYNMMQELKFALEGGQSMEGTTSNVEEVVQTQESEEPVAENFSAGQDNPDETVINENEDSTEEETSYANSEEEEVVEEESEQEEVEEPTSEESEESTNNDYALLRQQYDELNSQFSNLQEQYNALVAFKNSIEDKQKDELIKSFYMLDDEDKKDIIADKAKYSLEEIEAKLSVIYTKKQLAAMQDETVPVEKKGVVTYSLDDTDNATPDWVKAVCEVQEQLNF